MLQIGGKNAKKTSSDSKRHFTVVIENKEHGLYISSSPSSAAKKAVTKLCTANKGKKVKFYIREITQGSKKKTYGPYEGYIEKLKEPIELKGRIIRYKPVAKLSGKTENKMKGGKSGNVDVTYSFNNLSENSGKINSNATAKGTQILIKNINDAKIKHNEAKTESNEANTQSKAQREKATLARAQANANKKIANEKKQNANNAEKKVDESKQILNNLKNKNPGIILNTNKTAVNANSEETAAVNVNLTAKEASTNANAASQVIEAAKKNENKKTTANTLRKNNLKLNPNAPEFKPPLTE